MIWRSGKWFLLIPPSPLLVENVVKAYLLRARDSIIEFKNVSDNYLLVIVMKTVYTYLDFF